MLFSIFVATLMQKVLHFLFKSDGKAGPRTLLLTHGLEPSTKLAKMKAGA